MYIYCVIINNTLKYCPFNTPLLYLGVNVGSECLDMHLK